MTEFEELRLAYAECSRQKNELLTAHKQNAERVRVLREALENIERVMGPVAPPCCDGCNYEWSEALKTTRAALGPRNDR